MNHPTGFRLRGRRGRRRPPVEGAVRQPHLWHELTHMYLAGYIVAGFLVAGVVRLALAARRRGRYVRTALVVAAHVRGAGRAGAGARRRLGRARGWPRTSRSSSPRSRDWARRPRARRSTSSAGTTTARSSTGSRSRGCCRCSRSTTRTRRVQGLDAVPPDDRPPVNVVRVAFQMMVGIGTLLALLGVVDRRDLVAPAAAAAIALVLPRGGRRRAARRWWR